MEVLKHECGVAMVRLLKPLEYYHQKYGTWMYGLNKLYLLMEKQWTRYREDGFGLWCVTEKDTGTMVGQCGITYQEWDGKRVPEIGYLFQKAYWHRGYATEAAIACREYAFHTLGFTEVYSIIRDTNAASRKVAERNGMKEVGRLVKHYRGVEMPHVVYCVKCNRS